MTCARHSSPALDQRPDLPRRCCSSHSPARKHLRRRRRPSSCRPPRSMPRRAASPSARRSVMTSSRQAVRSSNVVEPELAARIINFSPKPAPVYVNASGFPQSFIASQASVVAGTRRAMCARLSRLPSSSSQHSCWWLSLCIPSAPPYAPVSHCSCVHHDAPLDAPITHRSLI